jgi:CRISPR-associated endoribonuclease Cas6
MRFPDKYNIQGMIYEALGDSKFGEIHDEPKFKYFTYSDFFYDRHGNGTLIVSSPDPRIIDIIVDWVKDCNSICLGPREYEIRKIKVIKPRLHHEFKSGSPVVLYLDSDTGEYFSFRKHGDISFFLDRLKDNALKKYEFFTGIQLDFQSPLFDEVELRRELAVPVNIRGTELVFIGSMWNSLVKSDIGDFEHFYRFLMDTGLGEKNSLGFGFINPIGGS